MSPLLFTKMMDACAAIFCLGARVHRGLPDHVVARASAGLCGAVLDALQDDAGIGAGFLAHTGVEGGRAVKSTM